MKSTLLSLFFLIFILYGYGQTTQKGMVTLFNSNKTPLPGTGILAVGATATDTDLGGNFLLTFPQSHQGQALIISEIYKKGYEVVNEQILYSWILSENRPLNIVMAPIGTINESKEIYYNVGLKQANSRLEKELEKLNTLYRTGKITLEQREEEIEKLRVTIKQQREALEQYAEYFARINPDEITDIEKKVLECIRRGEMDKAIQLFHQSQLLEQAFKQLGLSTKAAESMETYIPILYRYANTCMLAGGPENTQKAEEIYRKVAEGNPTHYTYVYTYGNFLSNIFSRKAQPWCEKAIQLANNDAELLQSLFLATICSLSESAMSQNNISMRKYYERFSTYIDDPNTKISPLVRDIYVNSKYSVFPMILYAMGDYENALKENESALGQLKQYEIRHGSDQTKEREVILNNIILCYESMKRWDLAKEKAEIYYELLLSRSNEKEKNTILLSYSARMSLYASKKGNLLEAEMYALSMLNNGAETKKVHLSEIEDYCTLYYILGLCAQKKDDNQQSLIYYYKGNIFEQHLKDTPLHALLNFPAFITILNLRYEQYEQAAQWSQKAMELAYYMENYNMEKGAEGIILSYYGKGILASQQNDNLVAKSCFEKAANLFALYPNSQISMDNVRSYILGQLSGIYYDERKFTQALQVIREAQDISLQKIRKEPQNSGYLLLHANNCSTAGSIETELKKSAEAIEDFITAGETYLKLIKKDAHTYMQFVFFNELNLSSAFYMDGNWKEAEESLNNISPLTVEAAEKYQGDYAPIPSIFKLYKGVLLQKTKRVQQGNALVAKALEELEAYSDNPTVITMLGYYKANEYYKDK